MAKISIERLYQQVFNTSFVRKIHKEKAEQIDDVVESALDTKELTVVRAFCGVYGRPRTFEQIATDYNLTVPEVRFCYYAGLAKLRRPMYQERLKALYFDDDDEIGRILTEQRNEIVQKLAILYWDWNLRWEETRHKMGDLAISKAGIAQIEFYEREQKREVVSLLAQLLVDWEHENDEELKLGMVKLAYAMRPSVPYVEYSDDALRLTEEQVGVIKNYAKEQATSVKRCLWELTSAAERRFGAYESNLTIEMAESMMRSELGVTMFDFMEQDNFEFEEKASFPALYLSALEDGMEIV